MAANVDEIAVASVFRALADPTRRQILQALRKGELAAGDIASRFPISGPSVSRHLAVLKAAGLVAERRQANRVMYSLVAERLATCVGSFLSAVSPDETPARHQGKKKARLPTRPRLPRRRPPSPARSRLARTSTDGARPNQPRPNQGRTNRRGTSRPRPDQLRRSLTPPRTRSSPRREIGGLEAPDLGSAAGHPGEQLPSSPGDLERGPAPGDPVLPGI